MRGLLFTEFLTFAEETIGSFALERAIAATDLPSGAAYTEVGNYPYAEMEALLGTVAQQNKIEDLSPVLEGFGRYLAVRFKERYADFFDGHTDAISFLASIDNHIHVEVRKLYPDAVPPRVLIDLESETRAILTYQSKRPLAHVALGLTLGSLEIYGGHWTQDTHQMGPDGRTMQLHLKRKTYEPT